MWIIPKNHQLFSHFALDMVESKEDLTLQELNIESSLMWRSKPTPLQTWLRRWKRIGWLRHLFTRILKPSQRISFEIELTSSLAGIPASRFPQQDSEREQMTPDTSGPLSSDTSKQLDLFDASLKTSKDILASDYEKSSKTWKASVTQRRGEYSARLKSAHLIRESESISLPTPAATSYGSNQGGAAGRTGKVRHSLESMAKHNLWPTPTARDWKGGYTEAALTRKDGKSRRFDALPNAAIGGVGTDIKAGHLNPAWVEWLMGVPTGWTDLGSWGTE